MTTRRLQTSRSQCAALAITIVAGWLAAAAFAAPNDGPTKSEVIYRPPDLGAPKTRTAAAARGTGGQAAAQILAPEHTGRTLHAQPALYWYLPAPSALPVEFTLIDDHSIEPLLEVELGATHEPGIYALRLADHGVEIEPGTTYTWSITQVLDPQGRSADLVATATLESVADPTFQAEAEELAPPARAAALAAQGFWYDAIDALSHAIDQDGDPDLRALRASLLEQVGLPDIAAYDRAGTGL